MFRIIFMGLKIRGSARTVVIIERLYQLYAVRENNRYTAALKVSEFGRYVVNL